MKIKISSEPGHGVGHEHAKLAEEFKDLLHRAEHEAAGHGGRLMVSVDGGAAAPFVPAFHQRDGHHWSLEIDIP